MSTFFQRIADRKNQLQKTINQGFEHAMNAIKSGDPRSWELLRNMENLVYQSYGLTETMILLTKMEAQNARWIHDHRPGCSFSRSHARMRYPMD